MAGTDADERKHLYRLLFHGRGPRGRELVGIRLAHCQRGVYHRLHGHGGAGRGFRLRGVEHVHVFRT